MHLVAALTGIFLIIVVLWDVFETIVLPRRVTRRFRLTRLFYRSIWQPWAAAARLVRRNKKRETFLSIFGPLSLLMLLTMWAITLVFAFALIHLAFGSRITAGGEASGFLVDLYYSGTTFFTLGLGDLTPASASARALTVMEASLGLGLLALVIGYFPVLYQAFSRREVNISKLDARAGTPPTAAELLRRYQEAGNLATLDELLRDWENWAADLLESHLSYPVLCFFRSQHDNQSWLAALSTMLDTCSLVMVGIDGMPKWQAQLTFKMARHTIVDIAQIFNTSPLSHSDQRLTTDGLGEVRSALALVGVSLQDEAGDEATLRELRAMYEPYTEVLSQYLMMPLPGWLPGSRPTDNWQTSAWEVTPQAAQQPFRKCMLGQSSRKVLAREGPATHDVRD